MRYLHLGFHVGSARVATGRVHKFNERQRPCGPLLEEPAHTVQETMYTIFDIRGFSPNVPVDILLAMVGGVIQKVWTRSPDLKYF